jgi:hypothetical protein
VNGVRGDLVDPLPVPETARQGSASRSPIQASTDTPSLNDTRGLLDTSTSLDINNPTLDRLRSGAEWRDLVAAATSQLTRPVHGRLALFPYSPPPTAHQSPHTTCRRSYERPRRRSRIDGPVL